MSDCQICHEREASSPDGFFCEACAQHYSAQLVATTLLSEKTDRRKEPYYTWTWVSESERKLQPARNVKKVTPRCCATCQYGTIENGSFECLREHGYSCDAGDMEHWFHVCERYQRYRDSMIVKL